MELEDGSTPQPHRRERWNKLDSILTSNNKPRTGDEDSIASARWRGAVVNADTVAYAEAVRPIPASDCEVLSKALQWMIKCYHHTLLWDSENEPMHLHLVAPIVRAVVQLVPDATVLVDEELEGKRVDARGVFEFVLVRGEKHVCIVQAKKDDFSQEMMQALLGCEVIADLAQSHSVCAVVTSGVAWVFLRSLDEQILWDEYNALEFDVDGSPDAAQLNQLSGKLYSMLTSDQQPPQ